MSKKITKNALLASTLMAGFSVVAAPAFAQVNVDPDVPPSETEMAPAMGVERDENDQGAIVVTGTLIRNPNIESTSPVSVVGEEEIQLRQENNAEKLVREIPGSVASVGSQVNNGNGGAFFANLRGLGAGRNLVLLDGYRLGPVGFSSAVDLNNIPLALIERVDALTGAAVTTYGADAVAGVLNFITKDDFAGVELAVTNQITEEGDGHQFRADLTLGANFDDGRGNATVSVGYQDNDSVLQGDREFSEVAIFSGSGNPGGSSAAVPAVLVGYGGAGTFGQIEPDGSRIREGSFFAPFNFNPYNIFQTPFQRFNIYGSANYEVTPAIEAYAQAIFSNNRVDTIIAPSGSFFNTYTIPLSNPFINTAIRNQICARRGIDQATCDAAGAATGPDDPNYREFRFQARRRFVEADPRRNSFDTTYFQPRVGVRGALTSTLDFDLYGSYARSNQIQRSINFGSFTRLQQALLASDPNVCHDPSGGCVPFNLFGPQGSITQEQFDFILVDGIVEQTSDMSNARGVISGDFGWASPWAVAPIGVAVGAEYRRYSAAQRPDVVSGTPGELLGGGGAAAEIEGAYDVREVFGEVIVPLIEDRPFFHSLLLEAGARYSDYSSTGGSFTWKVGGSFAPVRDIKFRGSYNKAERAPNIGELFAPVTTFLVNLAEDPCAGQAPVNNPQLRAICLAQGAPPASIGVIQDPAAGQAQATGGGNPNLDPEEATTWTAGVVLEPAFLPGFSATVDYYNIEITGAITSPTVGDVMALCFGPPLADPNDPACTGIRRNPVTGELSGSPADTPGLPLGLSNLGTIETSGVDLAMNYRRDLGFAGLALSFLGNWTEKFLFQATPNSINRECVGFYSSNCGSIQPEFSANTRASFTMGASTLSVLWRYISSQEYEPLEAETTPVQPEFANIPSESYFDLTAQHEVSENFLFTVSVMNVFDNQPHVVGFDIGSTAFNSGNVYPSTYDPLGRRYAVTARVRF